MKFTAHSVIVNFEILISIIDGQIFTIVDLVGKMYLLFGPMRYFLLDE